jgi:hypothetical protein
LFIKTTDTQLRSPNPNTTHTRNPSFTKIQPQDKLTGACGCGGNGGSGEIDINDLLLHAMSGALCPPRFVLVHELDGGVRNKVYFYYHISFVHNALYVRL